jgi:hypothetical protein
VTQADAREIQKAVSGLSFSCYVEQVVPTTDHGYSVRVIADGERLQSNQYLHTPEDATEFLERHKVEVQ